MNGVYVRVRNLSQPLAVRRAAGRQRRVRILRLLAKGPLSTGQLAELCGCCRQSVMWHIRILRRKEKVKPYGWARNEATGRDWCVWGLA
jgi:DNA-binding transcriptional ArsR family regulator